jgi:hypothetical protein
MIRYSPFILVLIAGLVIGFGCSHPSFDPITSGLPDDPSLPYVNPDADNGNHGLAGSWDVAFDIASMESRITPNRELSAHMNVTSLLPAPGIVIKNYNPSTQVVDVDITIQNPHPISGYDLRLIVYTDSIGHMLLNADDWTPLYDISGGLPINPFKAYAKSVANRKFAGSSQYTENLLVYLPGMNPNVKLAIDVSYPGNAEEPYEISGFSHGTIESFAGSSTQADVSVKDWQNDVSAVNLNCPAVTGVTLKPFSLVGGDIWRMTLVNQTGAAQGNYPGYVIANSTNAGSLALYDLVTITVIKGQIITSPANLIIKVNRDLTTDHHINLDQPFTLQWNTVTGAQEYAIYYDYEPGNPDYFVYVDKVTAPTISFNPPSYHLPPSHWVKGYKYVVRARKTAGDPASESPNSNIAFVMVSSFDSLASHTVLSNTSLYREGWVTAVERYPYATDQGIAYWPFTWAADAVSTPHALNIVPTFLGANWTVGTGENSDYYPGHILAITYELPNIGDPSTKKIEFCASCDGTWDCDDLGGVIIGSSSALYQPMDGWDGSDFTWAQSGTAGYFPYNWNHSDVTSPLPFDMSKYTSGNNCWRWQSG